MRKTEGDMLKYRNFGRKSLKEIVDILEGMGLSLGMDIDAILRGEKKLEKKIDRVEKEGKRGEGIMRHRRDGRKLGITADT